MCTYLRNQKKYEAPETFWLHECHSPAFGHIALSPQLSHRGSREFQLDSVIRLTRDGSLVRILLFFRDFMDGSH